MVALTDVQQANVDALVGARRLEGVTVDVRRASAFLAQAAERIGELANLTSAAVKYGVAYDAAHDIGEALLAACGYRTANGPGQHEAVGRFLRAVLDSPPGDRAAGEFDRLRRARNQDRYEAKPVGAADASRAESVARELYAAVVARGLK